jgi:hypothetical protein
VYNSPFIGILPFWSASALDKERTSESIDHLNKVSRETWTYVMKGMQEVIGFMSSQRVEIFLWPIQPIRFIDEAATHPICSTNVSGSEHLQLAQYSTTSRANFRATQSPDKNIHSS